MSSFELQEEARELLSLWFESRGENALPRQQFLDPLKLRRWVGNVSIIHVRDGPKRFYVALHGSRVARHLGPDFNRKYLEDVIPELALQDALAPYELSIEKKMPTYSVQRQTLDNGLFKSLERMALPCSTDDPGTVDRFLVWVAPIETGDVASPSICTPFAEVETDPLRAEDPDNSSKLFLLSKDWC